MKGDGADDVTRTVWSGAGRRVDEKEQAIVAEFGETFDLRPNQVEVAGTYAFSVSCAGLAEENDRVIRSVAEGLTSQEEIEIWLRSIARKEGYIIVPGDRGWTCVSA